MNSRRCVHKPLRRGDLTIRQRTHLVRWCVLGGRYSRAISSIKDLLSVWDSMSYAQKASPVEYSRLILDGEAIINDERRAWQKTGIRQESEKAKKESDEVQKESDKATDKATETALVV